MAQDQHIPPANNTKLLLLLLLLFGFVTMVLLTVMLVRMGSLDRRIGRLVSLSPAIGGGGVRFRRPGVEFFYVK